MATEQEDTTPAAAFSLQTIHLHGLGIPHGSMCTVTLRGMGRGEEEGKPGRGGGEGWGGGRRKANRGGVVARDGEGGGGRQTGEGWWRGMGGGDEEGKPGRGGGCAYTYTHCQILNTREAVPTFF